MTLLLFVFEIFHNKNLKVRKISTTKITEDLKLFRDPERQSGLLSASADDAKVWISKTESIETYLSEILLKQESSPPTLRIS